MDKIRKSKLSHQKAAVHAVFASAKFLFIFVVVVELARFFSTRHVTAKISSISASIQAY